jgi:hypothetical protein
VLGDPDGDDRGLGDHTSGAAQGIHLRLLKSHCRTVRSVVSVVCQNCVGGIDAVSIVYSAALAVFTPPYTSAAFTAPSSASTVLPRTLIYSEPRRFWMGDRAENVCEDFGGGNLEISSLTRGESSTVTGTPRRPTVRRPSQLFSELKELLTALRANHDESV